MEYTIDVDHQTVLLFIFWWKRYLYIYLGLAKKPEQKNDFHENPMTSKTIDNQNIVNCVLID